jgi:rhodanese-related sulfurtransferase
MDARAWTVGEVAARIDRGEVPVFIDTRRPTFRSDAELTVPGALRIPVEEIQARAATLPRDRAVVTYCGLSRQASSERAASLLAERGFDAHPLAGGFEAWQDAGMTVQADPSRGTDGH